MITLLLKISDYQRIFQVISAVIKSEESDPSRSCICYALFGAAILQQHYKLEPKIQCGLAAFHLGGDHDVLCFGEATENGLTATTNGFHCWVEVDGWIIDFMAPAFDIKNHTEFTSEPRMFQRRTLEAFENPNEMNKAGDFFLWHNQEVAEELLVPYCEHLGMQDLAKLCADWFKKPPKKILSSVATRDQNGKIRPIKLEAISLRKNWRS